ncbi:carbamoyltransferase HypF [Microbulbifer sp.]|uniref:carbamoyltransferase HypF n=1 Tax=Microbulbifer sp. TaxID=1908541 RepID=UPI00258F9410|nr:carbamoyltransferase HypF [Microbulbifer sp.]
MKTETAVRHRLELTGILQGVGFRPFVFRLARSLGLSGWVANTARGICIEVQGERERLGLFAHKLSQEKPSHAKIYDLTSHLIPPQPVADFTIRNSECDQPPSALILPDLAPCEECLGELLDPDNRRFHYPFINCTRCGPRFSIVERLPYDRAHTAMKHFPMCAECEQEYSAPLNRRFHAEPNACPKCGPQLSLCSGEGDVVALGRTALESAVKAIAAGNIVALKGVGGFQLLVDASNADAVARLRVRKQRPDKPFALLYPDIESVRRDCVLSDLEAQQLCGQERPIVILKAGRTTQVADNVAPCNPNLGVMLPASPLHYLLMRNLRRPVIASSGNLAGEPICIDNAEARQRLASIADLFLVHDRPIVRPLDDSILRVIDEQPVLLRRARGYAPVPILDVGTGEGTFVALGGDLKGCVAAACGNTVHLSQHLGDLENRVAMQQFERSLDDLANLYQLSPAKIVYDLHPGFFSSRWARGKSSNRLGVQHHIAHFFSCMAEHGYCGTALGVSWDGSGYGEDGSLRGSEFLRWDGAGTVTRLASLRPFPLPGGEQAIRDPRRILAGLLYEKFGAQAFYLPCMRQIFSNREINVIRKALEREINAPRCSSMGRLFDAAAVLLGLSCSVSFEGQAATAVEFAAEESTSKAYYPFELLENGDVWLLDWAPTLSALMEDGRHGIPVADRAAAFHNTLSHMVLAVVSKSEEQEIFLSGGVFQNRRLLETTAGLLRGAGFRVYCHSKVPPNDGGLSLGQIHFARCMARYTDYGSGDEGKGKESAPCA